MIKNKNMIITFFISYYHIMTIQISTGNKIITTVLQRKMFIQRRQREAFRQNSYNSTLQTKGKRPTLCTMYHIHARDSRNFTIE